MTPLDIKYPESDGHLCFGCSQQNQHGLRMRFFEDGETIVSHWKPPDHFYGHGQVLSGGMLAALCDETASWVLIDRLHLKGVTIRLDIRVLEQPVKAEELVIRSKFQKMKKNIAVIDVTIDSHSGLKLAEASVQFFTVP